MADQDSKCFACGKPLRGARYRADTTEDQKGVFIGSDCHRKLKAAGRDGWEISPGLVLVPYVERDPVRARLTVMARQKVGPARSYWLGGLTRHKGHPFVVDCGHRHPSRLEAIECAECLFYAPEGSLTREQITEAVFGTAAS